MTLDEDEAAVLWQDVLDDVAAGRVQGLRCPLCKQGDVKVDRNPQRLRLECTRCRGFIEGRLAE